MARAFVIRPFGQKDIAEGRKLDFDVVHERLIAPAILASKLEGGTTAEIKDAGNIREDMFGLIIEADLVICDITINNANVFYELGIRHALRKGRTILIKGSPGGHETPFDVLTDRYVNYDMSKPADACAALIATIDATIASDRVTDSPVFKLLPALPEADPDSVKVVPGDLIEEIGRAVAAKAPGWLRLLANEVEGRRFEWPALRLIGKAQKKLEDYGGARQSWDRIFSNRRADIDANLALADIYERLYRQDLNLETLMLSDQAIDRVLGADRVAPQQRAESLAHRARNLKTYWRLDLERGKNLVERRRRACGAEAVKIFDHYRRAYIHDLNHFWSGLAALQMGHIISDLADDEALAGIYPPAVKRKLKQETVALRTVVLESINATLGRSELGAEDRMWAEISLADHLFLTAAKSAPVIAAYKGAIPRDNGFAWNAAKGQLRLFEQLGVNQAVALATIEALDGVFQHEEPPKPHLILFAGHQVDEPGRATPRFPAAQEAKARELIREAVVGQLDDQTPVQAWASAAPGGDILFHEVCKELQLASRIYLPMPRELYSAQTFKNPFDGWRRRFLRLTEQSPPVVFSRSDGLPNWLVGCDCDPWERGNRWMLEMAKTARTARVTLLALWDGKGDKVLRGGTAHMVEIAEAAGNIDIVGIDATQLLA